MDRKKETTQIKKESVKYIDVNQLFFDSLRKDYEGFNTWFKNKQIQNVQAYVTKNQQNQITSFLMLKEEGIGEEYSCFEKPFQPAKRMKICTFKVEDTGKKIGELFIEIIMKEAIEKEVDEIYVTTFAKQKALLHLLQQHEFEVDTYKKTKNGDGKIEKEIILVKRLNNNVNEIG